MSISTRIAIVAPGSSVEFLRRAEAPIVSSTSLLGSADRLCRPLTAEELRIIQSGEPIEDMIAI